MLAARTSSRALCSHPGLGALCCRHAASPPQSCRHRRARCYAHAAHDHNHNHNHNADLLHWPEPLQPHKTPTPYQILQCRPAALYSKQRFYALVKLYHPDRCLASPIAHLPLHVRLDRYRMLVAAHDILSDAAKRNAYDTWGHGWPGHHRTPSSAASHQCHPDAPRWATDPRANATWEDWERWRHDNESGPAPDGRAMQLSNFAFLSLVFAFVSIGGVVQGTRFTTFNTSVAERRDRVHREATTTLHRSHNATLAGDRDERIRTFLHHRDAQLDGQVSYHRLLRPAETCASDTTPRP
ncbi:J domain-containing protein 1 [Pleosporales sp. CAS-2024a]